MVPASIKTPVRLVSWVLVCLWGAFWVWFVGAHFVGDSSSGEPIAFEGVLAGAGFLLAFVGLTATALLVPRIGGGLLVAAGLFGTWFYITPERFWLSAWLLMCLPVLLSGCGLLWSGGRGLRFGRRSRSTH